MTQAQHTIFIAGRGKLASELLDGLRGPGIGEVKRWPAGRANPALPAIVVHAGSGRELPAVIAYCAQTGNLLLDLSTSPSALPAAPSFPVVRCPNVNTEMLAFMAMVKNAAALFQGCAITLTESHQASKTSPPGTAIYLARALGLDEKAIRSVRDPVEQAGRLAIPAAHLQRHAYHEIVIHGPNADIRLETRVLGQTAYADGLARIIAAVIKAPLAAGFHDVVDLVGAA